MEPLYPFVIASRFYRGETYPLEVLVPHCLKDACQHDLTDQVANKQRVEHPGLVHCGNNGYAPQVIEQWHQPKSPWMMVIGEAG